MVDPVRLCVSGLAPGVTPSELEARFHPFGSVLSCEMIAPKVYDSVEFHRGLAYVTLTPKDPAALANCLAVYNGCKWRGGVLRCAPACPDYRERLRMMQSDEASVDPSGAEELEPESPAVLRLKGQTYGEVVTIASAGNGSHRALEGEDASPGAAELRAASSWAPLPVPAGANYTFEAHLAKVAHLAPPRQAPAPQETEEEARASALTAWLEARDAPRQAGARKPAPKKARVAAAAAGPAAAATGPAAQAVPSAASPKAAAPPVTIVHALLDKFAGSSDEEERMPFDPADLLPSASDSSGASELAEFLAGEEVGSGSRDPDTQEQAAPAPKRRTPVGAQPRGRGPRGFERVGNPALPKPPHPVQLPGVVSFLEDGGDLEPAGRSVRDLGRFGGASSDEDGPGPWPKRTIPQLDGAAPGNSSSGSEDCSSGSSDGERSTGAESSSSDEEEMHTSTQERTPGGEVLDGSRRAGAASGSESSEASGSEGSAASGSEGSAASGSEGSAASGSEGSAASGDSGSSDSGASGAVCDKPGSPRPAAAQVTERDGVPDWLAAAFPAGATFFRSEPLAMVEATWRVNKEAWTLDYKSKNRQAVRQAGKGGKYKRVRT
ncbi:hypothetical protein ACKKBF_B10245 [Auxenochlorella protothecoides x Auxenochlorella symbiontica]